MQATAVAHPNVALIKYWGKRDTEANLPATGSLSITLGGMETRTHIRFSDDLAEDHYLLDGREMPAGERVSACLDRLRKKAGTRTRCQVESFNDFPTGAGLASSASGFAALVLAAAHALGLELEPAELEELTRLGSGSAPRSLFGGFVLLMSGESGVPACRPLLNPDEWPLEVVVAVTDPAPKAVGSTQAMELGRLTSPYYSQWIDTHQTDLKTSLDCVRQRNFRALAEVAEHNCLKMHAVAMTSQPPMLYWQPATIAAMSAVRGMRANGAGVFFTIDAGPQVKAVCLPGESDAVAQELASLSGVTRIIKGGLGEGARIVDHD